MTPLEKTRLTYQPRIPSLLKEVSSLSWKKGHAKKTAESLRNLFPKLIDKPSYTLEKGAVSKKAMKIGVVFSGGQAPGGHNVIAAIFDALQQLDPSSELIGFLDGPSGIINQKYRRLSREEIAKVRNLGGFDLIGSGRTKIETAEQLEASLKAVQTLSLNGVVIIGGDDSNTNAAILAEYFLEKGCSTRVVGVPKTIDGDLRSEEITIPFGFDSACKVYSEMIGNIARDALSAKKYYHFIKLMGRSASHIALECALATHPNCTLIGEEGKSLSQIVQLLADLVCKRQKVGKEYGVVLIPEGLIEFIPEIKDLIGQLNSLLAKGEINPVECLDARPRELFQSLPEKIQKQFLIDRDPHGNVNVSAIATEELLIDLLQKELKKRQYPSKFTVQGHFFGYEGRACFPSNFDANYCYAMGLMATLAIKDQLTGVIVAIKHLEKPVDQWEMRMVPLIDLIHLEERKGKQKPVIQKYLVDLKAGPYVYFNRFRTIWEMEDQYQYPGPMQFLGTPELTDTLPLTVSGQWV